VQHLHVAIFIYARRPRHYCEKRVETIPLLQIVLQPSTVLLQRYVLNLIVNTTAAAAIIIVIIIIIIVISIIVIITTAVVMATAILLIPSQYPLLERLYPTHYYSDRLLNQAHRHHHC
jgi:hypothetical protein